MASSEHYDMPDLEDDPIGDSPAASSSANSPANSAIAIASRTSGSAHAEEDDEDEDEGDEWEETDEPPAPTLAKCLFCPRELPAPDVLAHGRLDHELDMAALVAGHSLDCFGYIRLVNFVRATGVAADELRRLPASSWADNRYMKPVIDCDPLLMIDVEDLTTAPIEPPTGDDSTRHVVNYEGQYVTLSVAHYEQLQHQLAALRQQLQAGEDHSSQLLAGTGRSSQCRLDGHTLPAVQTLAQSGTPQRGSNFICGVPSPDLKSRYATALLRSR